MLWIKSFHIVFMVAWFAGLFYLPRLFVYHTLSDDFMSNERFKVMERKLYNGIMTPTAVLTVLFGLWMILLAPDVYLPATWMHVKLGLVAVLIAYHLYLGRLVAAFKSDQNRHHHVFYRWVNEFPLLILVAVVMLVVVKPF